MSDANKIRVMTVDDHPLMMAGVAGEIDAQPDMQVVDHFRPAVPTVVDSPRRLPLLGVSRFSGLGSGTGAAFPEKAPVQPVTVGLTLLLFGMLQAISATAAMPYPEVPLQQLNHRAFNFTEGATSAFALAQTSDGTLWMGGPGGLTRFDGVHFVHYPGSSEEPLLSTSILSLLADPDGGLWIGFQFGGISYLKDGQLRNYLESDGLPGGGVSDFARDGDGSPWACARNEVVHFDGARWQKVALETQADCRTVFVDRRATLWVASGHSIFARRAGERSLHEVDRMEFPGGGIFLLAEAPDGTIWAASNHDLVRFDAQSLTEEGHFVIRGYEGSGMGVIAFDWDGNLWAAPGATYGKILRVPARELSGPGRSQVTLTAEILSISDGLSGDPGPILSDREGNIWLGTSNGLDRFSQGNVVRGPALCVQGRALAAGEGGALWVGCFEEEAGTTSELRDGAIVSQQNTPSFSAAYRDPQGTVWFGGPSALGHIENGRVTLTPLPPQLRGRNVHALVRDGSGALWVSIHRLGVFRYLDGRWSENGNVSELPRQYALVEGADASGTLWFGYRGGLIARLSDGHVDLFDATRGLQIGTVQSMLVKGNDVWAGGDRGLAHLDRGRFVPIHSASGVSLAGVSGIVKARNGDLWLNGNDGITRIPKDELDHVTRDAAYRVRCNTWNYLDGVPGDAIPLRPIPTAVETTDGHLWFSRSAGIISVDPTRLARNTVVPPVSIWSVTVGHTRYTDLRQELHFPLHTTNLQIDYSAGSLTVPERVQFRYILKGLDRDWQDAGTRRQALYTNLGPGQYTFRVIASNNDGVWNTQGAAVQFSIPPAFYQTRWFYALCTLMFCALLFAIYRVRVRQVTAQIHSRLEERLAERERIARDLHDTFFQAIQGLLLRFNTGAALLRSDEPARAIFDEALRQSDRVMLEGRVLVLDLRTGSAEGRSLFTAFSDFGADLRKIHDADYKVIVHGEVRDLHPVVLEESYRLGKEALSNAFRHSHASRIEAELIYEPAGLRLRFRDNGIGIDPQILSEGRRVDHWGLPGMRERARKIGAHIDIWSRKGAGTEIEVRIPASVAYAASRTSLSSRLTLKRFRRTQHAYE